MKIVEQIFDYSSRIRTIREEMFNGDNQVFADFMGEHQNTVSNWITRSASKSVIEKILEKIDNINPRWLLTGEGEMLKVGNTTGNIIGNARVVQQSVSGYVRGNVEAHNHSDEGKDLVIKEKEKEVTKMFEALLEELHGFHAISKRRDDYVTKQDEHIASILKHSYLRNDENMKRIDRLFSQQVDLFIQQKDLIQQMNELIRIIDRQNQKVEERADKLVDILERKM